MKPPVWSRRFLLALLLAAASAFAAPRTLTFTGTLTNTTADLAAPATLVLTIDAGKLTATLHTEPPLTGAGALTGRIVGGWCELSGELAEHLRIQFRGAFNDRDFRGTYTATLPNALVQYGTFQFSPPASAAPKPSPGAGS